MLQDDFVSTTRKQGLDAHLARQRLTQFGRFERIQPTLAMLLAAMDLQQNHSLSFWDALIVQTASAARCAVLYSEDLQAGARIGNVLNVNPFARLPCAGDAFKRPVPMVVAGHPFDANHSLLPRSCAQRYR